MSDKNIQVPYSLMEENLTISEIGAIVVLMGSPNLSWACKKLWDNDRHFTKTVESLQYQEIVSSDEAGRIIINFKTGESNGEVQEPKQQ